MERTVRLAHDDGVDGSGMLIASPIEPLKKPRPYRLTLHTRPQFLRPEDTLSQRTLFAPQEFFEPRTIGPFVSETTLPIVTDSADVSSRDCHSLRSTH